MANENTSFEFNSQSGAHAAKMEPAQREQFNQMKQSHAAEAAQHQQTFEREQSQRVAAREVELTQHQEANINAPRPDWAPAPDPLSADQIRHQARQDVHAAHLRNGDHLAFSHKNAEADHVRQSLGMSREESAAAYEGRRAAFMTRRAAQRERQRDEPREA